MAALINQTEPSQGRPRPSPVAAFVLSGLLLAGCSKPVEKVEEIRPVRAMQLSADNVDVIAEFSGDVRARVESRLGFRVGGKIVSRKVDVGSTVKRGQVLMQLDPQDLQLAQAQANAGLRAAESNRDLARAELKRYQELRAKNFVSQCLTPRKRRTRLRKQALNKRRRATATSPIRPATRLWFLTWTVSSPASMQKSAR